MSGGQRLNDHSSWAGSSSKESVLPVGNKVKTMVSAEGAGNLSKYEDNEAAIKSQQMQGIAKAKARPVKADYRN